MNTHRRFSRLHPDAYDLCDDFHMYEFKVRRCSRGRANHDWTDCPFYHAGEKARRRDPRRFNYSPEPCPDHRAGGVCPRGDGCSLSHGIFECWLHPARYRTQPCRDGVLCSRKICFFAHSPRQLRLSSSPASPVSTFVYRMRNLSPRPPVITPLHVADYNNMFDDLVSYNDSFQDLVSSLAALKLCSNPSQALSNMGRTGTATTLLPPSSNSLRQNSSLGIVAGEDNFAHLRWVEELLK